MELRSLLAPNPGPFTLQGTRTYLVGRDRVAVVDPGPSAESHVDALVDAVSGASTVRILLTHGHGDHAGAAAALAQRLDAPILGAGHPDARSLEGGESVETDAGDLVALHTPGHTADHLSFHWPKRRALFCGDLLLGEGETTWIGEYEGCVADYLRSLERLRSLDLAVIYPAHGPAIEEVSATLDAYERHRRERIEQVRAALQERPGAATTELVEEVYGNEIPDGLEEAAARSVEVIVHHLRVSEEGGRAPS